MSDAPTISQTGRLLTLTSPLGADVLIPVAVEGEEGLSRLFRYTITMVSSEMAIAPADILGKALTLSIARKGGDPRVINGIVRSFTAGPLALRGYRRYTAEIVPTLWLATLRSDCQVFQDKSVVQIVDAMLADCGVTEVKKQGLSGTHNARPVCVQYRETHFDFIARLLQDEGIFFYFQHEAGKHTLVLSDSAAGYADCLDKDVIHAASNQGNTLVIDSWAHGQSYVSGKWTLSDYNFETPSTDLAASTTTVLSVPAFKSHERFDYPGGYGVKADGTTLSRLRMEETETGYEQVAGSGTYRGLSAGGKITMAGHAVAAEVGQGYVLTELALSAQDESHLGNAGGPPAFSCRFAAIPDATVFRPPPVPRPRTHGPDTATVVGPSGEEIYCDKYGRVRVQFHWDRKGTDDEKSFVWLRVAQAMAGKNWGTIFTPRVGMEVLVDYLGGDPDRPLIVGCVYNGENLPPYTLPDNKTQSGIKTRSSKGGDATAFNELRFEDKKDAEEIYFHAQKDFKRVVENDDSLQVDHDQTITVKNDRTETVSEGNEAVTISKGNRTVTVSEGNDTHEVTKGNRSLTVGQGNRTVTVSQGNDSHTVSQGNRTVEVGQGKDTLTVGQGDMAVNVKMGAYSLKLGLGDATVKADAGKITLEAATGIELKVGANSVKIDQMGVTIKGGMVKLTGDMQVQIKGAMTQVNGDAMVQVKGGVVTIN
ncbi:type VI secretion system Vgr family protein [Azospirillum picis]|uniref:Type VI secretion system secreted protein VgrG n=1 Tax=Azospirillum picis TaxID=488438 RepID=A0ABU0MFU3_9PROT|nr:type VI secretion system tip protein TssI/VgrG [Azospirillum picis]MBP2298718.1 type VI secretion system secreted protein VgrG [Azospirillum picis]MDQ0532233.1 type VI secretion system secreted protein VgrG [Azospirillum picis]